MIIGTPYDLPEQRKEISAVRGLLKTGGFYAGLRQTMSWLENESAIDKAVDKAIGDVMYKNSTPFAMLSSQEYERADIFNLVIRELGKEYDLNISDKLQIPSSKGIFVSQR